MFAGFGGQGVCYPKVCGLGTYMHCVWVAQNTCQSYCTIAITTCAFTLQHTPHVVEHCLKQAELVITANTYYTPHSHYSTLCHLQDVLT